MTKSIQLTSRKPWVDAIRAIAMIFVVYGHTVPDFHGFFIFTSPVKIPLFFAITGYLFVDEKCDTKSFLRKWLNNLVLPYFIIAYIPILIFSFRYGINYFIESSVKLINGETYWFMPCLIVAELVYYVIIKYVRQDITRILICILFFGAGYVIYNQGVLNFACLNIAFQVPLFLSIGRMFRKYELLLSNMKWPVVILEGAIYLILCFCHYFRYAELDVHLNQYPNLFLCFLEILFGCLFVMTIACKFYTAPKFLCMIGKNTLILYLWAGFSGIVFIFLSKIGIELPENQLFAGLIKTVWAILFCNISAVLLNKYCPYLLGKNIISLRCQSNSMQKK